MLTRRASCSGSLITSSIPQHRSAATKLAPKWPQHPPPHSHPSASPIPPSNLGKWALPLRESPSTPTGTNSPVQWPLPKLKPAPPSHPPPQRPAQNASPSQLSQPGPSFPSLGKWARPTNLQPSEQVQSPSSPASTPLPSAPTYRSRDDPRLDRDIAPHQGRIPRPSSYDPTRAHPRRDPSGSSGVDRQESSDAQALRASWAGNIRRSRWVAPEADQQRKQVIQERQRGGHGRVSQGSVSTLEITPIEESPEDEQLHRHRGAVRDDHRYKTRGSLRDGGEIERRPRVSDLRTASAKKQKPKPQVIVTQDVFIPTVVSVGQLARLLGVRLEYLKRKMMQAGMGEISSYDHVLTSEYASMLALELNKNPIVNDEAAFDIFPPPPHSDPSTLPQRPPVVTIMGHVDHGKTTLLDTLRSASVAKGEAGGITQHIGAFSVTVPASSNDAPRSITFLDTPGHAAFSAMRSRGASVTDIIVLVVAADDGIMPQTKEVIELIKKDGGNVGVVVAINKVDKPGVDIESIQNSLLAEGVQLETYGGDIPSVQVSGLTGQGLGGLVETISAVAEMADYRAEQKGNVFGYVLESKVLKGLGPVATVLVLRGDLTPAKHLISGTAHARVRHLSDSAGKVVKAAYPGMAVTVSGWKELPNAGDEVLQGSEADIKKAIVNRRRRAQLAAIVQDAEAINIHRRHDRERKEDEKSASKGPRVHSINEDPHEEESSGPKNLRLVVKGDVSGSVEAVSGALQGIGNKLATVKIVQSSVGDVTESDIMMAKTAEGIIVAFSVSVPKAIEALAAANGVPILTSSVIYHLMDDIKQKIIELLPPIIETRVTGEATVQKLFDIQLKRQEVIKVAGCRVTNGLIEKSKKIRVMRNGVAIHEGSISTFRHLKKDVLELRKDMECGISVHNFDDVREGDIIQAIQIIQKQGIL